MQIREIENAVSSHKFLSLNTQNPREYGVNKSGIIGSLWIATYEGRKYRGTRVQTTGEVASILDGEIENLKTSKYIGEHHGYKYWYVEDSREVEQIIDFFGKNDH